MPAFGGLAMALRAVLFVDRIVGERRTPSVLPKGQTE